MNLVAIAAGMLQAVREAGMWIAETDTEFDPTKVSPGVMGFVMTGIFAGAVILLGFLLVKRLRRNAYRHEIREGIEQELAERAAAEAGTSEQPSQVDGGAPEADKPNQA